MLNTKAPLTLQDASALWGILNFYSLERAHVEVYILQSEDEELKIFLKSFLKNTLKKEINSLKQILSDNNIDYSINYPNRNINLTFELNEATKFRDIFHSAPEFVLCFRNHNYVQVTVFCYFLCSQGAKNNYLLRTVSLPYLLNKNIKFLFQCLLSSHTFPRSETRIRIPETFFFVNRHEQSPER